MAYTVKRFNIIPTREGIQAPITSAYKVDSSGNEEKIEAPFLEEIKVRGFITENEVLLVKRRLNDGKLKNSDVPFTFDNPIQLTKEQEQKGADYLIRNKENLLGFREESILKSQNRKAFLAGYTNVALYNQPPHYEPVYLYTGDTEDGTTETFEYYYHNGKVSIVG